jgi:hypothetical protein
MSDDMKQLKDEAGALSPAFSESLHERTMARVNRARRERLSQDLSRAGSRGIWFGALTGAAALAMVVVGLMFWSMPPAPATIASREPIDVAPLMASIRQTALPIERQFRLPMDSARGQIALLRDDARALSQFVKDQFDVLPAAKDSSL